MSQHSLDTDVNTALAALGSTMKGPGVPPAPLAGMLWLDDSANPWVLKIYDGADWIPVGTIDPSSNVFIADGLAAGRFFAPRANNPADLKLRLNAGIVFNPVTQVLTGVVSQETATLTAPVTNPRKDIVVIDRLTGTLSVIAGVESASPVDPAIPAGKLPVARINWTAGATAITTGMIDDSRVLNALGLGALAVQNFITDVPQNFALSGFLTPATITATQNNYNPEGLATVSTLRLSANAAHSITGLSGGTDGRILIVHNIGANNITIENEHAGSIATNRFALNADITLAFNQAAILQYDHISDRWRAIAYQPTGTAPGGLSRSLRFNDDDGAYLTRTPAGAGNRRTWTWSGWVKRGALSAAFKILFGTSTGAVDRITYGEGTEDALWVVFNGAGPTYGVSTTPTFRDPSAWYHVVVAVDTTQSTAGDRIKIYINGVQQGTSAYGSLPAQNYETAINNNVATFLGSQSTSTWFFDGYMTAVHFIDGQALDAGAFGEFDGNGTWMPKEYEGTYGNNGFWLDFTDNSGTTSATLGKDRSGNNNDWTPNNFSVASGPGNDSLIDLPVNFDDGGNGRGNYCTFSPLRKSSSATAVVLANGNLQISAAHSTFGFIVGSGFQMAGKAYWEVVCDGTTLAYPTIGVVAVTDSVEVAGQMGDTARNGVEVQNNGNVVRNSTTLFTGSSFSAGDLIMLAYDPTTAKMWFGKNGAWFNSGDPAAGTGSVATLSTGVVYEPAASVHAAGICTANFGQRPFAYPAPEGFKALNTQNLPAPAIAKPSSYMNPALYTGNGSTQSISGVGFQPNLVWLKSRSNALDHKLTDAIRGVTKGLESNTTDAESTDSNGLTAFTSDGFSLGSDATYNTSAATYAAWNWKTGVTPGFDILSYTGDGNSGRTVSHGLGVAPSLVIVKNRTDSSTDWAVWHQVLANTEALNLNAVTGKFTATAYWNSTTPSSSVLTLGNSALVNASSKSYLAYAWAEVPGFSRFGSYTGNGSNDGPFVWCGFRPAFLMTKEVSTGFSGDWFLYDLLRGPRNAVTHKLRAAGTDVEDTLQVSTDFLANGLKIRDSNNEMNRSGSVYLFAAFAENPFKTARAR